MTELSSIFENENEAKDLILQSEKRFNDEVERVARSVLSAGDKDAEGVRCLTLAGPSCSGKTTAASRLTAALEKAGRRARVVSIDDFYLEKSEMAEKNVTDFESADAINLSLFKETAHALSQGKRTIIPTFDFTDRSRAAYTEYIPTPDDIYIFEGIQAVYPQITEALSPFRTKSIFICVESGISVCGIRFDKNEIRLIRRIVRDIRHRNTSPEETMMLWQGVRQNEEKNIFPYSKSLNYSINSLLEYEIFLLCPFFLSATENYPQGGFGASEIFSLRQRLEPLSKSAVSPRLVPMNSVIREFAQ